MAAIPGLGRQFIPLRRRLEVLLDGLDHLLAAGGAVAGGLLAQRLEIVVERLRCLHLGQENDSRSRRAITSCQPWRTSRQELSVSRQ